MIGISGTILARADWRRVIALYTQFSRIVSVTDREDDPDDDLTGGLAEAISRTFAHYENDELTFMRHLFEVFRGVEIDRDPDPWTAPEVDQMQSLYMDRRLDFGPYDHLAGSKKRRPTPFEAAIETTRRIIDVNRLRELLANTSTAALLGGSLSYGRFFNTRGAPTSSDVDLMLIVDGAQTVPDVLESLKALPGVDVPSLDSLETRVASYRQFREQETILKHRVRMWYGQPAPFLGDYDVPGNYRLNLEIMSRAAFDRLILQPIPVIADDTSPGAVVEFRDDPAERTEEHRAFNGASMTLTVASEPVEGGFAVKRGIFTIDREERRFYPGTHLNVILPQFEVRWEAPSNRIRLALLSLRWKLLERLAEERRLRIFERQSLSASHLRSAMFAPHVRRRVDRE